MAPTPTQSTSASILAADAARALGRRLDAEALASVTGTVLAFQRSAIDAEATRRAAAILESIQPQVTQEIIEKLSGISAQSAKLAEAIGHASPPIAATDIERLQGVLESQFSRALAEWHMPPAYRKAVVAAIARVPEARWADLAPKTGEAIVEAVTLAETSAAREVAEDVFIDLDDLSLEERRELQKNVTNAIRALGTLVAIFMGVGRFDLATVTLALVAVLVATYWGLDRRP